MKKYPWRKWMNGREHKVAPSKYGVTAELLRSNIVVRGHRRGIKVVTEIYRGAVWFRFCLEKGKVAK